MKFLGTFTGGGGGTTRATAAPSGRRPRGEAPGGRRRPGFLERVARGAGRIAGRVTRGFRAGMRGA